MLSNKLQLTLRDRKVLAAILSLIILSSGISLLVGYQLAKAQSTPVSLITNAGGIYPGSPAYTIWTENNNYYAKDAHGAISSSTDAATLIRQVIAATTAGNIYISATGYYYISSQITIQNKNGITIEGAGNSPVLAVTGTTDNVFALINCTQMTIKNLRIDCNNLNTGNGIGLAGSSLCTIENVYVFYAHASGFLLDQVSFSNNILNCKAQNCLAWGFGIQKGSFLNTIESCQAWGGVDGFEISYGTGAPSYSNTISNCNGYSTGNCVYAIDYSFGNTITGCTADASGTNGYEIHGTSYNNMISNCISRNSQWSGITLFNETGNAPHDNTISSCIIYNAGLSGSATYRDGITLESSNNNIIIGNIISDWQGSHTTQYGIKEYGTSNVNIISDCQTINGIVVMGINTIGVGTHGSLCWNASSYVASW